MVSLPFGTWYGLCYFVVTLAGPSINYLASYLRQNCCTKGKFKEAASDKRLSIAVLRVFSY